MYEQDEQTRPPEGWAKVKTCAVQALVVVFALFIIFCCVVVLFEWID